MTEPGLAEDLAALDVVLLDAAEENADVVARLALSSSLRNISTPVTDVFFSSEADDLDLFADLHDAALDATRDDRAAAP